MGLAIQVVDDDFVKCQNAPYGQVLVLPRRRLLRLQLMMTLSKLNVSLISNSAPNLHSVICSEMNTASNINKGLLSKERGSDKFILPLETITFYCKNIFQLI